MKLRLTLSVLFGVALLAGAAWARFVAGYHGPEVLAVTIGAVVGLGGLAVDAAMKSRKGDEDACPR